MSVSYYQYNHTMTYSTNRISFSLINTIILCVLALLANLALAYFFGDVLHVPLFLDTIGTVTVVFYAGLVPGLIVGGLYNVLRFVLMVIVGNPPYPWDMMYALCGLAIVLCTWAFIYKNKNLRRGALLTVLYLLLIVLVSAFVSSLIGAGIETAQRIIFNNQIYSSPVKHFVQAFLEGNIGLFLACFITRIPVTVLDRFICTFAGWGLHLILKNHFPC